MARYASCCRLHFNLVVNADDWPSSRLVGIGHPGSGIRLRGAPKKSCSRTPGRYLLFLHTTVRVLGVLEGQYCIVYAGLPGLTHLTPYLQSIIT